LWRNESGFTSSKKDVLLMKNKWMKTVTTMSKNINMFGKRKKNGKGVMWASLLGLGMSAAAYSMGKNQNPKKSTDKLQSLMENFQKSRNIAIPNAALAEFAKEIAPEMKKSSQTYEKKENSNFSESIPNENHQND
jgi:hypothetical protein